MPPPVHHPQMERDGVSPDALSYSQALRACRAGADGSGRAAQLALALVGEVRSRGLEPGVVILESAARWAFGVGPGVFPTPDSFCGLFIRAGVVLQWTD